MADLERVATAVLMTAPGPASALEIGRTRCRSPRGHRAGAGSRSPNRHRTQLPRCLLSTW